MVCSTSISSSKQNSKSFKKTIKFKSLDNNTDDSINCAVAFIDTPTVFQVLYLRFNIFFLNRGTGIESKSICVIKYHHFMLLEFHLNRRLNTCSKLGRTNLIASLPPSPQAEMFEQLHQQRAGNPYGRLRLIFL